MTRYILFLGLATMAGFSLAGCAEDPMTTSNAASAASSPGVKTYSHDDLQRTGRTETGEALQAADPSVQNGGR